MTIGPLLLSSVAAALKEAAAGRHRAGVTHAQTTSTNQGHLVEATVRTGMPALSATRLTAADAVYAMIITTVAVIALTATTVAPLTACPSISVMYA